MSASAAGASAALTQAVQPAAGSTTRAGSVEMVSTSESQPPLHFALADLATVLNEQWKWHGTSYQVRYVQVLYAWIDGNMVWKLITDFGAISI